MTSIAAAFGDAVRAAAFVVTVRQVGKDEEPALMQALQQARSTSVVHLPY